jgi:hypothetical protein
MVNKNFMGRVRVTWKSFWDYGQEKGLLPSAFVMEGL